MKKITLSLMALICTIQANYAQTTPCVGCCERPLEEHEQFFVMLPVVLFILTAIVVMIAAKKAGFNFMQAMYAEDPEEITKPAPTPDKPDATVKVTLTDEKGNPVYYPSSSRLIAFLTGLTTLGVIVCFISYSAYCMMKCRPLPDFKHVFEIVVGLGLGIVPYSINKITNPVKS